MWPHLSPCAGRIVRSPGYGIWRSYTAFWAGISIAELARLQVEDFTVPPAELWIEPARSARRRRARLARETAAVFERWRGTQVPHPSGLFLRLSRTGLTASRHTTPFAIASVVRRRAKQAGMTPVGAPHLRRTAIYNLIETGVSLADAHRRFGFVSHLTLTARYDHRDLAAQRRFVWLTTDLPGLSLGAASSSKCHK